MKEIIILGTLGNCIDILDTLYDINHSCEKDVYRCVGFLDDDHTRWGQEIYGIKVLGSLNAATEYKDCFFVNGIGSPNNFWKKQEIIDSSKLDVERFETIIHPTASVSSLSRLGFGVVVFQHVTVTSNVKIGNHVIILPNSVISHDDEIGDYTCIAGCVCVCGNVKIGRACYLGANCTIINDTVIGDNCLVGMGSVVIRNISDNSLVVGNPARVISKCVEK